MHVQRSSVLFASGRFSLCTYIVLQSGQVFLETYKLILQESVAVPVRLHL